MKNAELNAARASSRAQGYWLLSRLFLEPPSQAFLLDLQAALAPARSDSPRLQADIDFLRQSLLEALQDPERTAVEFTRCLVLVPKGCDLALPFESHFRKGPEGKRGAERLREQMADWGYGTAPVQSAPADHLGAELRLMAWLCNDEREAWQQGDTPAAIRSLERQGDLLSDHLTLWVPDYCKALEAGTENTYLQAIARIGVSTLEAEPGLLDEIHAQADDAIGA